MRFDLTDLRLFLHVQETGSITAGARRSNMTLASASERARHGRHAGRALLLRGPRGAEPTPAGRTLAHHARLVLAQMDRMRGDLDQYGQGLKGLVRVQCNTTALSEHLPPVLGEFLQRHPRVSVDLEERPSHEIADALRAGTCDIGVLADSADLGGLRVAVFRHDPLCLIVPSGHALARAASSRWPTRRTRISSGWSKAAPCRSTSRSTRAAMARACPTACGCAVSTRSAGWWARAWAWRSCARRRRPPRAFGRLPASGSER